MRLTRAFLDGAGFDAEIIDAAKLDIKPCLGCFGCWKNTPGKCVINDDMSGILNQIIGADVIIWSFPPYYFSVPSGLKALIDRQLPLNLPFMSEESVFGAHAQRYDLPRKRVAAISTCGFWTAAGNYDGVAAMFDRMYGKDNWSKIFCGQGELFRVPELSARTDLYLKAVRRTGAEFAKGGITQKTQAGLAEPLYERKVFEQMADASWGAAKDGGPPDGAFDFTTQMAAPYRPDGKERVIEFVYTDIYKRYQIVCRAADHDVIRADFLPCTTRIETPFTVRQAIARGEISGFKTLLQKKYRVTGDFSVMKRWNKLFGAPPRR
jgi:multimeric flavodoxin WrbA